MKNVQIVFNIQVPEHVSEQEVSARLHQAIGSILDQEFGLAGNGNDSFTSSIDDLDTQIGHA
ncbi:MAG: hypothetical protein VX564_05430 [Nitrospirota bacterium]|nr:hypothetical protein [Nitrospirota bacterium]